MSPNNFASAYSKFARKLQIRSQRSKKTGGDLCHNQCRRKSLETIPFNPLSFFASYRYKHGYDQRESTGLLE